MRALKLGRHFPFTDDDVTSVGFGIAPEDAVLTALAQTAQHEFTARAIAREVRDPFDPPTTTDTAVLLRAQLPQKSDLMLCCPRFIGRGSHSFVFSSIHATEQSATLDGVRSNEGSRDPFTEAASLPPTPPAASPTTAMSHCRSR